MPGEDPGPVTVTVTTNLVPALAGGRLGDAPVTSLGTHHASVAGGRRVVELVAAT